MTMSWNGYPWIVINHDKLFICSFRLWECLLLSLRSTGSEVPPSHAKNAWLLGFARRWVKLFPAQRGSNIREQVLSIPFAHICAMAAVLCGQKSFWHTCVPLPVRLHLRWTCRTPKILLLDRRITGHELQVEDMQQTWKRKQQTNEFLQLPQVL